jgi:hypothetical protein
VPATTSAEFTLEWPTDALTESRVSSAPHCWASRGAPFLPRGLASVPLSERAGPGGGRKGPRSGEDTAGGRDDLHFTGVTTSAAARPRASSSIPTPQKDFSTVRIDLKDIQSYPGPNPILRPVVGLTSFGY